MICSVLDLKERNPYLAIAYDEAMLYVLSEKKEFHAALRVWKNSPCIVPGRTCNIEKDIATEILSQIGNHIFHSKIPVIRRASGGGTVIHGPGNINFSLFFNIAYYPSLYDVKHSYEVILNLVRESLLVQGFSVSMQGQSDLAFFKDGEYKKISGNAQFRKKNVICHHGTIITSTGLIDIMKNYLQHPPKEPEYRKQRRHESFLGSLDSFSDRQFYMDLQRELLSFTNHTFFEELPGKEINRVARNLVKKIYGREDWTRSAKHAW